MTPAPFSLRIFVADGDPDGLRFVEKFNWIGKALVFLLALLPKSIGAFQFLRSIEAELEINLWRAEAVRQSALVKAFQVH